MPRDKQPPVRVILPEEPPKLSPSAARALLKILMEAHEKQEASISSSANGGELRGEDASERPARPS